MSKYELGRVKSITFGLSALGNSFFQRSYKTHFALETSEIICTILWGKNHVLKIILYTAISNIQKGCKSIALIYGNCEDYQYSRLKILISILKNHYIVQDTDIWN